MGYPDAVLSLLLTDDDEIQSLNEQYRGKDKPTDVLSFSQGTPSALRFSETFPLGDIVISVPTAERQAEELEVTLAEEILRLSIHGLLHLLGYEHEDVPEERVKEMEEKEEELYQSTVELLNS